MKNRLLTFNSSVISLWKLKKKRLIEEQSSVLRFKLNYYIQQDYCWYGNWERREVQKINFSLLLELWIETFYSLAGRKLCERISDVIICGCHWDSWLSFLWKDVMNRGELQGPGNRIERTVQDVFFLSQLSLLQ